MKTKIIAIANQKGGVGKTTTVLAMSAVLQEKGLKTLVVDGDIQGNSTFTYGAKINDTATLFDVLLAKEKIPGFEAIQKTNQGFMIASDPLLIGAEKQLWEDHENSLCLLKEALDKIKNTNVYDFIIIDTNPYIGTVLYSALIASDQVIIPMEADVYSLQGIDMFQQTLDSVKNNFNPNLETVGFLLTKFNPRVVLSREIRDDISKITEDFNTVLFDTTIRSSQKIKDAQAAKMSILDYAPKCTSALDYIAFVEEYLKREEEKNGK